MNQVEKFYTCPACTNKFSSGRDGRGNRLPRLLQCGHTVCETCIRSLASPAGFVSCPLCKDLTSVEKGVQELPEDVFVLGLTSATSLARAAKPNLETKVVPANKLGAGDRKEKCFECGKTNACYRCDNCVSNYCQTCFKDVHEGSKSLKKHKPKLLRSSSFDSCTEHDRPFEFYCNDDQQVVCSYCVVMGKHKGHSVVTVADWSKESTKEIPEAIENVKSVVHCLKKTEKKLQIKSKEFRDYFQGVVQEVICHFMHLHGLLQIKEYNLISEISNLNSECIEDLTVLLETVSSQLQDASVILSECSRITAGSSSTNPAIVLEKLKSLTKIPCHVYIPPDEPNTPSVELNFDPMLKQLIASHGKLSYTKLHGLSLRTALDLPVDYASEEGEDTTDTETASSVSEVSLDQPTAVLAKKENLILPSQNLKMPSAEHVVITHIKNPLDFYVQRCSGISKLKQLFSQMNRPGSFKEELLMSPEKIEVGDLYLARYSSDGKWYRCRVTKVLVGNELDLGSDNSAQVEVFYIDYGNSEITTISKLQPLPPRFAKLPEQAVHCSLLNLAPSTDDGTWSQEAVTYFARMTQNKPFRMEVVETVGETLKIDLRDSGGRGANTDASVCDALVFGGHAYYLLQPNHRPVERMTRRKQYYKHESLTPGQIIEVTLCHIESPDCIYVQECGNNVSYLENMTMQLQKTYNSNRQDEAIYYPAIGMVCVAQFSADQMWYRAKIVGIKGTKVEVVYVDYGNKEVLPLNKLRKVGEKFMKLPEQAFSVALADVQPASGDGWTDNVKNFLVRQLKNVKVLIKVEQVFDDAVPSVSVYMPREDEMDVCVNALLVKENLAESSGVLSMVVDVPNVNLYRKKAVSSVETTTPELFETKIKSFRGPETKQQQKKEIVNLLLTSNKTLTPVQISHISSVSCFYVHMGTREENGLVELIKGLQKCYQLVDPVEKAWSINEMCAALHPDTETWFRGRIATIGELLDIYAIDFGYTVKVDPAYVQVLSEKFKDCKPYAVQCHLAEISPAGGSNNWSKTAIDYFKYQLSSHETIYLHKMGEEVEESLPVDIMLEYGIPVGVLEPLRKEYKSMRECLRSEGYGFFPRKAIRKKEEKQPDSPEKNCLPDGNGDSNKVQGEPVVKEIIEENKELKQNLESLKKVVETEIKPDLADKKHTEENELSSQLPKPEYKSVGLNWVTEVELAFPENGVKSDSERGTDGSNETEAVVEQTSVLVKGETVLPFDPRDDDYECEGDCEDVEEEDGDPYCDNEDAPVMVKSSTIFKWKPAIFPEKTQMHVMVLHVSEAMGFYVRILDETVAKVKRMNEALYEKYNNLPNKSKPIFSVGQACIAKYDFDNKWYRGEIIGIDGTNLKVRFVDYGTIEAVPPSLVHTELSFIEDPILCHLVYLHGIRSASSDGLWPIDILDIMHFKTVEKTFLMTVHVPPEDGNCAQVSLHLSSGNLDLQTVLLSWKTAEKIEEEPPTEEAKSEEPYNSFPIPEEGIFPVVVTNLLQTNLICAQISRISSATTEQEESINRIIDEFLILMEDLGESAEDFDEVSDPYECMPCCGKFTADDCWYRGQIISIDNDHVRILYVDYGNTETIPMSRIRKLPEKYLDVPMQAHVFRLHGLKVKQNEEKVIKTMKKKLFENTDQIFARVKVPGNPTEVDLLDLNLDLLYQPLEDEGLISIIRTG